LAEYDNVAMPNLRLGDVEIQALLAHIEEESRRREPHDEVLRFTNTATYNVGYSGSGGNSD
jgi:hypothetical protein